MVSTKTLLAVALLACATATPAWADVEWTTPAGPMPPPPNAEPFVREPPRCCPRLSTLRFHWDNDRAAGPSADSDRWYTNGLALELAYQPAWARALGRRMPGACLFPCERTGAGFVLGQLVFTPEDIRETELIEDDRPYAGYLYAGVFWQRANDCVLDHLQLDVGIVGPSAFGEEVQTWYHQLTNIVEPEGWDNQLENEPTIQLYARRKWRFGADFGRGWRIEAIPNAGFALGTVYRDIEAGLVARVGVNLPDDFGPARLADPGSAYYVAPCRGLRAYVFGRASGKWVQHNLFLDGNTWRDSHDVDKEPWVAELEGGLMLQYGFGSWNLELIWSTTFQTEEFELQDEPHQYGRLTVGASWRP